MKTPAYEILRFLGMRPAIARHFLVQLRKQGFVVVKEAEVTSVKQINQKIEVIIKLMKQKGKRK